MRRKVIAGNWKLNKTIEEAEIYINELKQNLDESESEVTVIIGAPLTHIHSLSTLCDEKISISSQDCSQHVSGAYTGEVSAQMLSSVGATFAIVGHSERRAYHNETNADIAIKIDRCLEENLQPIYCCGEQLSERDNQSHFEVVKQQIEEALFHLNTQQIKSVIVAYEPVWAIGTGKTASAEQAQEMHAFIRSTINTKYGNEIAQNMSILYGGSCKPNNAEELFSKNDVDGGLIGGASLNPSDFIQIINAI